jgi:signal peptidase I
LSVFTRIRRNEYFKSALVILLIVGVVLGIFFGVQFALGTSVPIRVVESGSMCVPYDGLCNGWSHPFEQTLHVGDIIVIQKVNPADLNANYPNSDIIVYENPNDPTSTPIVHRIVETYTINGTIYVQTKGDGNSGDNYAYTFVDVTTGQIRPAAVASLVFTTQAQISVGCLRMGGSGETVISVCA